MKLLVRWPVRFIEDDLASTPVLGRLHAQASDQTTETTDPDPEDSLAELLVESKYAGANHYLEGVKHFQKTCQISLIINYLVLCAIFCRGQTVGQERATALEQNNGMFAG